MINIPTTQYCGYISIIGRPNVGKSTLLNRCLGEKISITSRKPQTTRHTILGIKTSNHHQLLFVDTPGLQLNAKKPLNKILNKSAQSALHDMNAIIFVVRALQWQAADQWILEQLKSVTTPILLAISQIDRIKDKAVLLPFIENLKNHADFQSIIPISAKTDIGIATLLQQVASLMPEAPHLFSQDDLTDRSLRFLVTEIIREKLMRLTGQELPYATVVEIEQYQEKPRITVIHAIIWVAKNSQKPIVIGDKGQRLKLIGQQARLDIEALIHNKVLLKLWVKVKSNWNDNEKAMRSFGY